MADDTMADDTTPPTTTPTRDSPKVRSLNRLRTALLFLSFLSCILVTTFWCMTIERIANYHSYIYPMSTLEWVNVACSPIVCAVYTIAIYWSPIHPKRRQGPSTEGQEQPQGQQQQAQEQEQPRMSLGSIFFRALFKTALGFLWIVVNIWLMVHFARTGIMNGMAEKPNSIHHIKCEEGGCGFGWICLVLGVIGGILMLMEMGMTVKERRRWMCRVEEEEAGGVLMVESVVAPGTKDTGRNVVS